MARFRTNLAFGAVSVAAILLSIAVLMAYLSAAPSASVVRLGYFPNVTHAQALYGIATGFYQRYLGAGITLDAKAFSAGPIALQALLSNQLDMIFVGPSPTLNGLTVAPDVLRVIAGGASGGALFVIQPGLVLATSADYTGKKFATPLAGNTQDIALKHFLLTQGHKTLDQPGGDVDVINAANADILSSFKLGQIDGAWVPEPWATRLVREASGRVFLDERSLWPGGQFVTTQLVTTKRYLDAHRSDRLIRNFLDAQVSLTLLLQNATTAALGIVNDAIGNATGSRLADATIAEAFTHLNVTYDPIKTSLATYLTWAQELAFLPTGVSTNGLYDLTLLNDVLMTRGLPPVM